MKFFWIVILLLLSPLVALLFFRKNGPQAAPSDKSDALLGHTEPAVLPEESEYSKEEADDESAEALFRQWLGVIYRDKPEEVDAIIANLEENTDDEEELDYGSIIESFFLLHNNLGAVLDN